MPVKNTNQELDWLPESEGQLSIDVLEDDQNIYLRAAVAGTRAEDLDIVVTHDTVTIRGKRLHDCSAWENATSHLEECFWGTYSRSIVLSSHVRPEGADAIIKNGILSITIPKIETTNNLEIVEWN